MNENRMKELPITLIVLTRDEELHLERCLSNAREWVEDIVVVDSGSKDGTVAIAKKFEARIYEHPFKNQAEQFNWALENVPINTEWVLRLDADEYALEDLWKEIAATLPQTPADVSGYYIKRRVFFMGRWIKHGGYYPSWFLRLFRKGKARYEVREMDEHLVLLGGRGGHFAHDFVDYNIKGLEEWIERHNDYSTREARAYLRELNPNIHHLEPSPKGQAGRKRWAKTHGY